MSSAVSSSSAYAQAVCLSVVVAATPALARLLATLSHSVVFVEFLYMTDCWWSLNMVQGKAIWVWLALVTCYPIQIKEKNTLEIINRAVICSWRNLSHKHICPTNDTIFTRNGTKSCHLHLSYECYCPISGCPINNPQCMLIYVLDGKGEGLEIWLSYASTYLGGFDNCLQPRLSTKALSAVSLKVKTGVP